MNFPIGINDIWNYDKNPETLYIDNHRNWDKINWKHVRNFVLCKQVKIFEASKSNNKALMHSLQEDLLGTFEIKLLATRWVVQDNKGSWTKGFGDKSRVRKNQRIKFAENLSIDGLASPIRRKYIPKPGKSELRPLGIPSYKDRAKQAIVKILLEPQWEAKFSPESYGFRPGLAQRDAIASIAHAIKAKDKFVLDGDIRKCFDRINHDTLIWKIETFEVLEKQIKAWLKAGYHDELNDIVVQENEMGTPQGGIISPLLMNIALHGIEDVGYEIIEKAKWKAGFSIKDARAAFKLVWFADDFVAFHTKEWVIRELRTKIGEFLKPMGLELHDEKTSIKNTLHEVDGQKAGFDFLGVHFMQFKTRKHSTLSSKKKQIGYTLKVFPAQKNVWKHIKKLWDITRKFRSISQPGLISKLSPTIRGFANYYKSVSCTRCFSYCDSRLFRFLYKWALSKHNNKGKIWVYETYFKTLPRYNRIKKKETLVKGRFNYKYYHTHEYTLYYHTNQESVPYHKKKRDFSIFNPDYINRKLIYFQSDYQQKLYNRQNGICRVCHQQLIPGEPMEIHHLIPKLSFPNPEWNKISLQWLIHTYCHQEVHKPKSRFIAIVEEEPDEG